MKRTHYVSAMVGICSQQISMARFFVILIFSATVLTLCLLLHASLYRYGALFIYPAAHVPKSQNLTSEAANTIETILKHLNQTRDQATFPADQVKKYLLLSPNICTDVPRVHILIIVHTAPANLDRRNRMRNTFARRSSFLPFQIRTLFLLAKSRDAELQRNMKLEHAQYKDIIVGDFYDDYHNLTLKGTMGFRWISEYCPNSDVILKLDDDVIVDMRRLLELYTDYIKDKRKSFFCYVRKANVVQRSGKWKLPPGMFQNLNTYPYHHCQGFALLITSDLAFPLYQAAKVTPFFWIDDIYLYGILPKVVGGVTFHDFGLDKYLTFSHSLFLDCLRTDGRGCQIFSALLDKADRFDMVWNKIQEVRKNAPVQLATIT